jgi:hypothetical protein
MQGDVHSESHFDEIIGQSPVFEGGAAAGRKQLQQAMPRY